MSNNVNAHSVSNKYEIIILIVGRNVLIYTEITMTLVHRQFSHLLGGLILRTVGSNAPTVSFHCTFSTGKVV